jgi:hypothetical protein
MSIGLLMGIGIARLQMARAAADAANEVEATYTVSSSQPLFSGETGDGSGLRDGIFTGDVGTSVFGSGDTPPEFIIADLGEVMALTRIKVWPITVAGGFGFSYDQTNGATVAISSNDVSWTDVGTLSGAADNVPAVFELDGYNARYIRLTGPTTYIACGDFRIYATPGGGAPATPLTWNAGDKAAAIVLSNGNLTATNSGSDHNASLRAETALPTGKWHWETTVGTPMDANASPTGIASSAAVLSTYLGDQDDSLGWYNDGSIYINEVIVATVAGYAAGARLVVEYDADADLIWLAVGAGDWNNSPTASPATGTEGISTAGVIGAVFPAATLYGIADSVTLHSDNATFTRAVSTGFTAYAGDDGTAPPVSMGWDTDHQGESTLDLTGYTLDFHDPFTDSSKLYSEQYSIAGEGGSYTAPVGSWFAPVHAQGNGAAAHLDPDPAWREAGKPNPFSYTSNPGAITITMEQSGGEWQSGSMQTADWRNAGYLFNRGYAEMRAKFDNNTATWYAFWLISQVYTTGDTISERIEYDIVEAYGGDPGHHNSLHMTVTDQTAFHAGDYTNEADLGGSMFDGEYHTYGALITDTHIITYWDGLELARMDITSRSEFERAQFHLIVTLAGNPDLIGSASGQSHMVVDYVKLWLPPA